MISQIWGGDDSIIDHTIYDIHYTRDVSSTYYYHPPLSVQTDDKTRLRQRAELLEMTEMMFVAPETSPQPTWKAPGQRPSA